MKLNIKDIDKAVLVAGLFNNSKPLGLGFFAAKSNTQMTAEDAQRYLDKGQTSFDYLEGRVMKVNVAGDEMDSWGYDRDNGEGAAKKVVDAIRSSQSLEFNQATPTNPIEEAAATTGNTEEAMKLAGQSMSIYKF